MAHSKKDVEFVVDKAIEAGIFKTLAYDNTGENQKALSSLVEELKEQGISLEEAYRVVSLLPDGKELVYYTSRDGLVELLSEDEDGFDFIWKTLKEVCEINFDEERGCSTDVDVKHEDYEEMQ